MTDERWIPDESERARFHPISRPDSTSINCELDAVQTELLIRGVTWHSQDDRWQVWSEDPGSDGRFRTHVHRSWTGNELLIVDLERHDDGSARTTRLTWETDEALARDMDRGKAWTTLTGVCTAILGMDPLIQA